MVEYSQRTSMAARRRLSRHITGTGIEVGPGHHPFYLPFGCAVVRYVDRWRPADNRALFPELGDVAGFPEPDVVANFDTDGLAPVPDTSQDFVIASHVLEHLASPLRFLGEIYRVLRPGGSALILLPDKRRTFDAPRATTELEHVIAEYDAGVCAVNDDHLKEFLLSTSPHEVPTNESGWNDVLQRHRLRSVHVHCWTENDFPPVVEYAIAELGQHWELVDAIFVDDGGPDSIEFGYVLRRSISGIAADQLAHRFMAVLADTSEETTESTATARLGSGSRNL